MMWNLADFGDRAAAVLEDGSAVSYAVLERETEKLASRIAERCLAFVLCGNCIGSLIGYVGFINHRIVPLMLDAELDGAMLGALVEAYRPAYIWHPLSSAGSLPPACER
jgi:acyl-CoA synthetase (AMP-forming)/AMP-acid ligase II